MMAFKLPALVSATLTYVANAIFNTTGARVKALPLNPENVWRVLTEAGKNSVTKT